MELDPVVPVLNHFLGLGHLSYWVCQDLRACMPGFLCPCTCCIWHLWLNTLLLGLVTVDITLQDHMYQLLGLLAAADLILATFIVPKALAVLWDFSGEISFGGCLAQLFVVHVAFISESSVLLATAVDCCVASASLYAMGLC